MSEHLDELAYDEPERSGPEQTDEREMCRACNGMGALSVMDQFGRETEWTCDDCEGRGWVLP